MRLATAFFLLTLCGPLAAQPCDPAQTKEVCPDTTDWKRYFPLGVGNVWHYYEDLLEEPENQWSWSITGEAEVEGEAYVTLERCDDTSTGSSVCRNPVLLRYDETHDMVVRYTDDGDMWWDEIPCRLSADFNEGYECTGPGTEFIFVGNTRGAYDATVTVPPDVLSGDTRKEFQFAPGTGPVMYAGLGATVFAYDLEGNPPRLVYAYVDGQQYGTPAFASCDPATTDDVCPDTTDWRRYYPLEVGNQWQYAYEGFCEEVEACRWGNEIVGTEVIDGVEYFLRRRCNEDIEGEVTCSDAFPVRYGNGVDLAGDGRIISSCLLDLPFNFQGEVVCDMGGPEETWSTSGSYGGTFGLGEGPTLQGSYKSISSLGGGTSYFAGIGGTYSQGDGNKFGTGLVYARINGVEYGTSAFAFPTAGEPEASPTVSGFTAVFPNPVQETLTARYTLAASQTVTLEVVDLLGRRVRTVEAGRQIAGQHEIELETDGLLAGLYVLQLRGDEGMTAVRRVAVVR